MMSLSTTLTLNPVSTIESLQSAQYGQNINNHYNNNTITSSNNPAYYPFSHISETNEEAQLLLQNDALYTEEGLLLERLSLSSDNYSNTSLSSTAKSLLHKSNSYSGSIKPKATVLKQDSLNGRIATSLTDSDNASAAVSKPDCMNFNIMQDEVVANSTVEAEEQDPFLLCSVGTSPSSSACTPAGSNNSSRRGTRTLSSSSKTRNSFCARAHAFINRNWYLSYLVPASILLALVIVAYLARNYAKRLLYWIETQNPWVIFALFMLLFVIVSFPIVVGYFVLMITSGYLFGCLKGFLTVILGANLGIAVAHITIRSFRHRIPMQKLIKNETGRAILRVISGPRAFKVVLFTRLTPIPFGIQNAIFGVSSINPRIYHSATFLGLLPAQTINVYLGSTLRSMHEVLNSHGTAVTGYISFVVEVICGVALMFWVVQKARKELSETLLSDISNEGKLIDIQV